MAFIDEYKKHKGELSPEMEKILASMAETLDEQAATMTEPEQAPEPQKLPAVQLPLWPEPARGTPNSFLRSALFAAIQGKDRRYMKGEVIAAQKGVEIKFTGMMLDQSDFDVWLQAAHLARCSTTGNSCTFKGNAFLKGLGLNSGKSDYVWLKTSLARLQTSMVEIKIGSKWKRLNLLNETTGDDETAIINVYFNPLLIKLFGNDNWTGLQWEERRQLKGKPLAKWLHGFYSSHAEAFPLSIDYIREKSGSGTKEKRYFKNALQRAFTILEQVAGIKATFEGDIVTIERPISPTQARHLIRKITASNRQKKRS